MAIDYKQAGVDIEAGDALVDWLKSQKPKAWPHQERLISGIGGFAGLFQAVFPQMKEPCLVACTDGVGTKVKLAVEFESYAGVAQDLVAMCVNDLICSGAQPLFFLDYYATGKLQLEAAKSFLGGIQNACIESECALLGGETAEMPGVYQGGDFDCAGFAVGVVDRAQTWGAHQVQVGDQILAIESSGAHSNGYSLLRKVFEEDLEAWSKSLLVPTHLYVKLARKLRESVKVHALANITGGGMDNVPRVLPENTCAELVSWEFPELFKEVQKRSGLSQDEMLKTLNCGVGMALILAPSEVEKAKSVIQEAGFKSFLLGEVKEANGEASWRMKS